MSYELGIRIHKLTLKNQRIVSSENELEIEILLHTKYFVVIRSFSQASLL